MIVNNLIKFLSERSDIILKSKKKKLLYIEERDITLGHFIKIRKDILQTD